MRKIKQVLLAIQRWCQESYEKNEAFKNWELRESPDMSRRKPEPRPEYPPAKADYPHGSVPYDSGRPESWELRAKRIACSAVNHHPRRYTGSWCSGYGYVCSRCYMYADPLSPKEHEAIWNQLGNNPDSMEVAAAFGGGPHGRRRS